MPLKTKIVLSDKELALIKNRDWILTKRGIMQKVYELLSESIAGIDENIKPAGIRAYPAAAPKISKGENYLGLPYVTLDHPRIFDKQDIFAVRTMFWWGNFFSITLHISGTYKTLLEPHIRAGYAALPRDMFICVHAEQWHHHFENDNYVPVHFLTGEEADRLVAGKDFMKLAFKFDLEQIGNISELLQEGYQKIGRLLV
jgi:hypothetical protein